MTSAAIQEGGQDVWGQYRIQFILLTGGGTYLSGELDAILLQAGARLNTPVHIGPAGAARLDFSTLHVAQGQRGAHAVAEAAVRRDVEFR